MKKQRSRSRHLRDIQSFNSTILELDSITSGDMDSHLDRALSSLYRAHGGVDNPCTEFTCNNFY